MMRYDPLSAVRRPALSHGTLKRALLSAIFIASLTCAARAETNSQQLESARANALDIALDVLAEERVTDIARVGVGYPPGDRSVTRAQDDAGAAHAGVSNLEETIVADFTHVFTAFETQREAGPLIVELLPKIAAWISHSFDLPEIDQLPRVQFVSSAQVTAFRYQLPQPPLGQAIEQTGPYLGAGRAVVAVYDKDIIYLSDRWRGGSPAEQSVLIHEMVHHLQQRAQLRYGCPQEREKLAYQVQERWLTRFGATLQSEFEIDPMTLFLHSACLH